MWSAVMMTVSANATCAAETVSAAQTIPLATRFALSIETSPFFETLCR
jgi:hypothetical protein